MSITWVWHASVWNIYMVEVHESTKRLKHDRFTVGEYQMGIHAHVIRCSKRIVMEIPTCSEVQCFSCKRTAGTHHALFNLESYNSNCFDRCVRKHVWQSRSKLTIILKQVKRKGTSELKASYKQARNKLKASNKQATSKHSSKLEASQKQAQSKRKTS